jgi:hypothetical protein
MEKIVIFENENSKMVCYPDLKIVHNKFVGSPTGKQFREALEAGIGAMEKYECTKWLSDDSENMAQFAPEDHIWADNDWFPRMQEVGWKTWAMVVPNEIMGRLNVKDIVEKNVQRGIRMAVFSDLDKALGWLVQI